MAQLGDVCIINPKVPPIDDSMLVSFVPMQRVGEEGEFDPSELRTYADVKKGFTYFADADVLFATAIHRPTGNAEEIPDAAILWINCEKESV